MNSSMPGRYSRPMQLLQQLDLSSVPMSSYSDLANLMDVSNAPHSNSVNQHLTSPVENSNSISSNRSMTGDYSTGRPAADFCMPSMSAFPPDTSAVTGLPGNFAHFQHFQNQVLFPENSYHSANPKATNFAKPWYTNNQLNEASHSTTPTEPYVAENVSPPSKPRRGRKPSAHKKEKKEKVKRVRYIKPGCTDLCRRRCKHKISQSQREDLFNTYWNLEDDNKKKEFISRNAIRMPMMKCKEGSRRNFSVDWAFTIKGESFSVCKLFFLHTLDIPENAAYAAIRDSAAAEGTSPSSKSKPEIPKTLEVIKPKLTWFETDLDDYSHLERKGKYSRKYRYGSYTKIERFRELRPGCKKCRRNCQSKFTYEERLGIFNEHRGLSNIRKQREYISQYIQRMEKKRIRAEDSTRRACSIQWTLPLKGKIIPVCKTFFLHTVGISERTAYNIGLQNEIQPVERPTPRPKKSVQTLSGKGKSAGTIIAKGKLRSALKLSRKKKKKKVKVESDYSDFDEDDEYYLDSWREKKKTSKKKKDTKKGTKKRGRKRKRTYDKTVKYQKVKMEVDPDEVEVSDDENDERKLKSGSTIKISSTLFKLPIKKRENLKHRVPVLRIKQGRVLSGKKRNPYKRKDMPTKNKFPLCPENCKKRCRQNLSDEAQKEIFNEFWCLTNMDEQRDFISKCVKRIARPTCRCLVDSHLRGKRRGYKITWNLNFRGLEVPVCKTFFMHVLQISDSVVYKAVREDDSFIPDVTILPCKHFTGENQVPKPAPSKDLPVKITKTEVIEEAFSGVESAAQYGQAESQEAEKDATVEPQDPDIGLSSIVEDESVSAVDKVRYHPNNEIVPVANVTNTENVRMGNQKAPANVHNVQNVQKILSPHQLTSQNNLCNIEANYETLIPSLNSEHSQDSNQALPVHFPNQLMAPCDQGGKPRNVPSNPQGPLPPHCHQNDMWPKPMDTYHPAFSNNHPVFPTFSDSRMEPVHNMTHRDLASHFGFPQNNNHPHFPPQASSSSHHGPTYTQLHPNLQAAQMNHAGPMGFDSDLMGNFYHNPRFHNFNSHLNMPRECVPNGSDYSMDGDHQNFHDALLMQTLKKTNGDMFQSNPTKPTKPKKKKKKSDAPPKPKSDKPKEPRKRKGREKKPFTKHIKAGCVESCKRKCLQKVPPDAREKIFNDFWNLENDTRRREYILPIVKKVPKKTCKGVNSRRCCTIEWGLPCNGELQIVCRRFFLDTFDIGEKFVKTVFDKIEQRGGSMEDLRGRHCKRSNVFMKEQEQIEKHVRSLSTLKAHQCISCKKDFTRWCLHPGIVVSQMYKLYADQRKMEGGKPACRTSYSDVLVKKFNLKNNVPQENMCDVCGKSTEPEPQDSSSTSNTNAIYQ